MHFVKEDSAVYQAKFTDSTVIQGDCESVLANLPDNFFRCCITSPPYWGLRDYGDENQIGAEDELSDYIERLARIFDQVFRVLTPDGSFWLNVGDSYTSGNRGYRAPDKKNPIRAMSYRAKTPQGLKEKDLIGVPWRLALALQDRGWFLRSDIIWEKPNCMPESVRDRPTRSHEYLFLLTKSAKYYYDRDAIKEINGRNRRTLRDFVQTTGIAKCKRSCPSMRGTDNQQDSLFSYSQVSDFVPADHPLRRIRSLVDETLDSMQGKLTMSYSHTGRPSIAPERIIRALLLQILYSVRSERRLVEEIRYNMLYRWFVGMTLDDPVWDASTFSKNRARFVDHHLTGQLLQAVIDAARKRRLLSEEHFCVDGTLIEAWASMGSYRRKDDDSDPPAGRPDFHGEQRRSDTHECKTDPDARLYRKSKGQPAQLCYIGHILTDNRHALVADAHITQATGTAEVDAALLMLNRRGGKRRLTVGADKLYDQDRFITGTRAARVTPHVAQNTRRRRSCIDSRTTRHTGYAQSINARHRVETPFGWGKFNRPLRKTMLRGLDRVGAQAKLVFACYNLVRIASLAPT